MALQIRRGVEADRTSITPAVGEPIYTTDNKELFIGDGSTAGGISVTRALTVDTQDFTASGTWTKPANALWVEVTMCGGGEDGAAGTTGVPGSGGNSGRIASKTFLASSLSSTVSVTCGAALSHGSYDSNGTSSFGALLYAPGASAGGSGYDAITAGINYMLNDQGGIGSLSFTFGCGGYVAEGRAGAPFGPGGGGSGGSLAEASQSSGFAGGKSSSGEGGAAYYEAKLGGGGAGGASGTTGVAGTAGGYDTITGFGNGGGGGGEGTGGAGGAGGAAVRGGGGGGGGQGTTAGGAGGAGGAGFVRVRTLCFG